MLRFSMKTQKFLELIKEGENNKVEFKSKISKSIGEEICAFGNAKGGYIFIGITDDGDFEGCNTKSTKEIISQHLTNITPPLEVNYHLITIDDKDILIVEVPSSKHLCAIGGTVFIRIGTSKRPLSIQEILAMGTEYLLFEVDRTPTEEKEADKELVEHFVSQSRTDIKNSLQYLRNIGVWTKKGKLTIAGLLLFNKDPQSYLPHAAVRLTYHDDSWKRFTGPLWKIVEDLEKELRGIFSLTPIQPRFKRIDIHEYPMKAVREAIINAIAHRNYAIKSEVFLNLTPSSLKIKNPGSFPPGTTPEEPNPIPRNPIIYELMFQMGFVERQGCGIELIQMECKKHPFVSFKYNLSTNFTEIVFKKEKELLSNTEKEILSSLSDGEKTASEISSEIGMSKVTILRKIERLSEINFVEKIGKGPSTRYRLGKALQ